MKLEELELEELELEASELSDVDEILFAWCGLGCVGHLIN